MHTCFLRDIHAREGILQVLSCSTSLFVSCHVIELNATCLSFLSGRNMTTVAWGGLCKYDTYILCSLLFTED